MRALLFIILSAAVALLSASLAPWVPLVRSWPLVTIAALVLLMWSSRSSFVVVIVLTAFLIDAIAGYPIGVRAALLLSAVVVCWPLLHVYDRQRRFSALLVVVVVLAFADAIGIALGGGAPPAATVRAVAVNTFWMIAAAYVLHWFSTRSRPRYGATTR